MTVALDHPVYSTVYNVRSLKRFYARNVHFVGTTDNRENSKKPVEKETCKKSIRASACAAWDIFWDQKWKEPIVLQERFWILIHQRWLLIRCSMLKHLNTSNARTPVHKNLKQSESIYQRHDKLKVWKETLITKPVHLFHPIQNLFSIPKYWFKSFDLKLWNHTWKRLKKEEIENVPHLLQRVDSLPNLWTLADCLPFEPNATHSN